MECTQRLECTQDLYETHTERTCPEQIGFLGICGAKHPVVKGPNKIGRDPQTCNIILNLNSVSRQHAVINVLNSKEYMLMDLDSANKTKLQNKTLQPYIPHPLRDGDTVQFGDIFGIFRLLEEDDNLPMTQALDIPETPVVAVKHVTKLHKAPTTVIPESPDVSDRDDSFVTPQPKGSRSRLSSSSFLKLSNNKTQTLLGSSPKTDSNKNNSKLPTSLSFVHNPNTSLNESFISLKCDKNVAEDIHEAATQAPNLIADESADSIYTADTQIPPGLGVSPSIHSLDTQVPPTEHLPQVRKIDGQHEMQLDIYAANKENNRDIFNAETQPFGYENHLTDTVNNNKSNLTNKSMSNCSGEARTTDKSNTSEEELMFEEIDDEILEDFNSQNILEELPFEDNAIQTAKKADSADCKDVRKDMLPTQKTPELPKSDSKPSKRIERAKSDSSTDCEDINNAPTQVIPVISTKKAIVNEEAAKKNETNPAKRVNRIKSDSSTDCEDIDIAPTQIIPALPTKKDIVNEEAAKKNETNPAKRVNRIKSDSSTDCEDIDIAPTQIIPALPTNKDIMDEKVGKKNETKPAKRGNRKRSDSSTDCEEPDQGLLNDIDLTQKIPEIKANEEDDVTDCEDDDIEIEKNKPPTVDLIQDDIATQVIDYIDASEDATNSKNVALEDQATQIIDQVVPKNIQKVKKPFHEIVSPFKVPFQSPKRVKKDISKTTPKDETDKNKPIETIELDDNYYDATQDIYEDLCSQKEDTSVGTAVASNADVEVVPCSVEDYKVKDKFANIERDLTLTKNKDGVEKKSGTGGNDKVANLKKMPSDSSDPECTPKKFQFIFTDSDLPDSQEIKTSMMSHIRTSVTESSSDSEPENCTEEYTPYLKRKKKSKPPPKVDLTKMFEKLPERVITRQRKPTYKLLSAGEVSKNSSNILKPTFLTEQEDQIDSDIITENIKRLKTFGKGKNNKDSKIEESKKEETKESTSRKKADNKSKEPKEKIKVKIEKPKRKDTKSGRKSADLEKNNAKEDSLDSTSADKPTTRRTRSKKKENDSQNSEKRSVSPEVLPKEPDNKRKRTNKKQKKERSVSPEIEIRRSKRNQKSKDKSDDSIKAPVSILKKSIHEQSTVYNISSSSSESPKGLKRSMVDESDVPSSKRTRSQNTSAGNNTCNSINNASLRATPARVMKTQRVLLTAFPSAEVKQKLEKLGAVIVTEVLDCSVVLTMQIKRTFKLLCAVGLGRPIVGPGWVQACVDTNIIVDPWLYLIKDEQAEKRFQFDLQKTLTSKRNFLQGYSVSSTPSVQPNTAEMKMIVECSGGFWREGGAKWVCVSCSKDSSLWPALRKRGATVVSTEFILGGVLRQKIEIESNTFP